MEVTFSPFLVFSLWQQSSLVQSWTDLKKNISATVGGGITTLPW
jgi:hypothetical protein